MVLYCIPLQEKKLYKNMVSNEKLVEINLFRNLTATKKKQKLTKIIVSRVLIVKFNEFLLFH